MRRGEDEGHRLLALGRLGSLSSTLAREALESGVIEGEPDVLAWTGSTGMVHGHLVVLWLDRDLAVRVNETPAVVDALTAAVASAVAKVSGNALAELKILGRAAGSARATPYRGRF